MWTPYDVTKYNIGGNSKEEFDKMKPAEKYELVTLIQKYCKPRKSINKWHTSYGLKHYFERFMSVRYIGNGEMKGAMLYCGYTSNNQDDLNWCFNISEKSPILLVDGVRWHILSCEIIRKVESDNIDRDLREKIIDIFFLDYYAENNKMPDNKTVSKWIDEYKVEYLNQK